MNEHLEVGIAGATTKQLLRANLRETRALKDLVSTLISTVQEGTTQMADLTQSVEGLKTAVTGLQERLSPLQEALRVAQETIAAERAADATEDADYEAKITARDEALSDLSTKVDAAVTDIDKVAETISGLGEDPAPDA